MGPFFSWLSTFFPWLVDYTIDISILICLIFVIKLIASKKLPAWWHYCLWVILLLRMIIPWKFDYFLNIPNVVPFPIDEKLFESVLIEEDFIFSRFTPELSPNPNGWNIHIDDALLFLWLTGAIIFGIYILFKNVKFWITIKKEPLLKEKKVLALLEECKNRMNTHTPLRITVTDKVKSPALFGYIQPRLLLPVGVLEELGDSEMSYIFMHELGHLKRHDIAVSCIAAILQIFQWFNPLVWIAFHQMRIDQEAACDASVLSRIQRNQTIDYASTIVGFLENFYRNHKLPAMVGILENRTQIKKRITMIVNYRKYSNIMMFSSTALLIIIAVIFFSFEGFATAERGGPVLDPPNLEIRDNNIISEKGAIRLAEGIKESARVEREIAVTDETELNKPDPERQKALDEIQDKDVKYEMNDVIPDKSIQKTSIAAREIGVTDEVIQDNPAPERQKALDEIQDKDIKDEMSAVSSDNVMQKTSVVARERSANSKTEQGKPDPEAQKVVVEVKNRSIVEAKRPGKGIHEASAKALKMFKEVYNISSESNDTMKHNPLSAREDDQPYEAALSSEKKHNASEQKSMKYLGLASLAYLMSGNQDNTGKAPDNSENKSNEGKIFNLKEVDERVKIVSHPPPRYPYIAQLKGIEGRVILRFIVDKTGNILDPEVVKAEPGGVFEQAALDSLNKYKLKPAKKDGKRVNSVVQLALSFAIKDNSIKLARN